MLVTCPKSGCKNRFEPTWGHLVCPLHAPCIAPGWVYDPSRCCHCADFFNSRIIGAQNKDQLKEAKGILNNYIKKIKGFALKYKFNLKYSSFVYDVRATGRPLSYYQELAPININKTLLPEHTLSESESAMSLSPYAQSMGESSAISAPPSEASSRRSTASSSASRILELEAELKRHKSFEAAHGLVMDKPYHPKKYIPYEPDVVPISPARSLDQDTNISVGLSSLPLSLPITVISCVSASSSVISSTVFSAPVPIVSASSSSQSIPFPPPASHPPSPIPVMPPPAPILPSSLPSSLPHPPPPPGFSFPPSSFVSPPSAPFYPPSFPPSAPAVSMAVDVPSSLPLAPPPFPPPHPPMSVASSVPPSLPFAPPSALPSPIPPITASSVSLPPPLAPPASFPYPAPSMVASVPSVPLAPPTLPAPPVSTAIAVPQPSTLPPSSVPSPTPPITSAIAVDRPAPPPPSFSPPPPAAIPPPSVPPFSSASLPGFRSADGSVSFSPSVVNSIMSFVASLSSSSGDVGLDSASAKASPSGGPSGSVQGGSSGQLGVRAGSSSGDGLSHSVNQGRSVSVDFPSAAQAVPVAGPSSASYFGGDFGGFGNSDNQHSEVIEDCQNYDSWDSSVENWSQWRIFDDAFAVLYDGNTPRSVLEQANGKLTPYNKVKFCKGGDGKEYISTLNSGNVCRVKPGFWSNNKNRVAVLFELFPHLHHKVDDSVSSGWGTGFAYGALINDEILPAHDLPLTIEKAESLYTSIASGSKYKSASLKPSCMAMLKTYAPLLACLPAEQFKKEVFSKAFTLPHSSFVGPDIDLLKKEHKARLDLLCITIALSACRAFGILFKSSDTPSTLDASVFSFFVGLQPFIDYAWNKSFERFAEARAELRKSAFKAPYGHQASRLIYEDPFSVSLFSPTVLKQISDTLSLQNREWADLVKLTPQAEAVHEKAKNQFINALIRQPRPQYNLRRGNSPRGRGTSRKPKRGQAGHFRSRTTGGRKFRGQFRGNTRGQRGAGSSRGNKF